MKTNSLFAAFCIAVFFVSSLLAAPNPNFHLYLLFGQSNMAGGCKPADSLECDTTSAKAKRVKVLAFTNCENVKSTACTTCTMNRKYNQWYTAFPPYHNCSEGIGPADHFGKTLLDSIADSITIGFIPCALSGVDIAFFQKGIVSKRRKEFKIPPDDKAPGAYQWMVDRCKLAQKSGVIKGILFHQGESNCGEGEKWVEAVVGIVKDLRADLGLSDSVPFIAGELRYQSEDGCCFQLNPFVNTLPQKIKNCSVVSANGITARNPDKWRAHFSTEGMREFGKRYAVAFLKMAGNNYVPRKVLAKK
jgi:hypothetical protein